MDADVYGPSIPHLLGVNQRPEVVDNRIKPIPGTERWHYEEFLRLAAAEPDNFDQQVDEKNKSEAPLQEHSLRCLLQ